MKILTLLLSTLLLSVSSLASSTIEWARIQGTIDPASSNYFRTAIQKAKNNHAQALIVELDTPGGLLSSVRDMAQAIDASSIPVVVYVTPAGAAATSAGALLMLASHVAAMAPGTNIGAAHPVGSQGEDIKGTMGQKVTNDTAAFARGLAEIRGRSRELAEDVVSKSRSFTADEALKEKLIDIEAPTLEHLLQSLNGRSVHLKSGDVVLKTLGAQVDRVDMSLGQVLLHFLANPNIAAILMTLGMLLIYVELSHPGLSLPGILGAICLIVAFMAFQALPIRAGGLILLLLGVGLMIAEPFVVSHGAIAAGGILSFILGLVWLMNPAETTMMISPEVWIPAAVGMTLMVAIIGYAAARTRRLAHEALAKIGGFDVSGLKGYAGVVESTKADGHSGKVNFRGELWNFVSEKSVSKGDSVRAVRADGMIIHIRPASHS